MILELSVLGGAAALLLIAIRLRREGVLLAAVTAYTNTTIWLLHRDLAFVLPALSIAIALGLMGIVLTLRIGEVATPSVTKRHRATIITPNKMMEAESIGP